MAVRITTKLQILMMLGAVLPVSVIIMIDQVAIGAGIALLVGLLGPYVAEEWLVTRDLQAIRRFCQHVKDGKYLVPIALPNELAAGDDENEFVSVRRDMNWMARAINLRESQLKAVIDELAAARQELLDQKEEMETVNKRLIEMAMTDSLTGLSNRRHFFDHLEQEVCRVNRNRQNISLFMLDVDHFKKVNDTHGHQTGDTVLQAIAAILRNRIRRSDMVARIGGEEFAVLLSDTDSIEAMHLAEQIRISIKNYSFQTCDGQSMKLTCSIGVCGSAGCNTEQLYKYADLALYHAKNSGRDRVAYYDCEAQGQAAGEEQENQKGVTH